MHDSDSCTPRAAARLGHGLHAVLALGDRQRLDQHQVTRRRGQVSAARLD
jgi:hypothetical protein